jgi:outer membrane receptor for ferrienterochelin and colicins
MCASSSVGKLDPLKKRPSRHRCLPLLGSVFGFALIASPASAGPVEEAGHEASAAADGGDDVHAVDAIVVTGSRTERPLGEAPVATEVITRDEIVDSGARSLGELLEERPGIFVDRGVGGAAPQLQGLPADYTLILIDGVRQPGRVGGVIDLDRFSIEDIERVEIVRGSASALYGSDAIAGVINIITRKAKKPLDITGQGSYGAYGTLDLSAGVGIRRATWSSRVSGGYHSRDAFDLDPSDVATSQSASKQYNLASQNTYSPIRDLTLTLTGDYRHQDRNAVDVGAAGGAVFDRENRTETGSVLLKPEWKFGSGSRLELRSSLALFRDQFLLDQRDAADLDELQDTREQLAQFGAQFDRLLGASHLGTLGSELAYESLRATRLVGGRGTRKRGALYIQDEWTLLGSPLLVLLPGARLDIDSQFGAYPTPRVAVRFDPLQQITLRASYGWGFKAPDFRELYLLFENPSVGYLVEGNTELKPEKSRNVNVGAEYRPHRTVWLSVQGFYNDISDRIGTNLAPSADLGPQRFVYQNVDSAHSLGIDSNVRLSPLPGLRVDLGYSWTRTRNESDGQPLSGTPLHRATASVRYGLPSVGLETMWRAAFIGSRPFYQDDDGDGAAERVNASGYASVDARLAQRLAYGFSTFLLAENLLNAGDVVFAPLQPRTFSGGVTLDY